MQLQDWERYFAYKKVGQKYIIEEIFNQEKPKAVRPDSVYTKLIELTLMNQLSLETDKAIQMTKMNLYEYVGLINYFYNNSEYISGQIESVAKQNNISFAKAKYYYNEFNKYTSKKLDRILFDALNSMQKRSLIFHTKVYIINEITSEGKIIQRDATKDEVSEILEITKNFKSMHPEFKYLNYYNCLQYCQGLNEVFRKTKHWDSVYLTIQIIINKKYIRADIPEVTQQLFDECKKNKLNVNSQVVDSFNNHFEELYKKINNNTVSEIKDKLAFNAISDEEIISRCSKSACSKSAKQKFFESDFPKIEQDYINFFIKIAEEKENKE